MSIRPICPELAEKANVELGETPTKLKEGVQHLKEWIQKQPHLRARTDDQWLAVFLRGCKYRLDKAKQKIDLYYSVRNRYPELFAFRPSDPRFKEMFKTGYILILPKLSSPTAPRVGIIRPALSDPKKFGALDFFSLTYNIEEIMFLEDDAFVISGNIAIMDFKGCTLSHLFQMSPMHMKKFLVVGQDASPLRLKAIHLINCLPIFVKMFNILKKLLSEKHRERVFLHSSDMTSLVDHVSKDILPDEYGGTGGTVQEIVDYWLRKIDEYQPWWEDDWKNYGTDESLRPAKIKEKPVLESDFD